jgi:hypothetical protein
MSEENNTFDDIIKDKFKDYQHSSVKPDWAKMASLLKAKEEENIIFDSKIKESLEDLKVYSQNSSWAHFKTRRDLFRKRQREILSARLVEACLLILIFCTLNRLGVPEKLTNNNNVYANISNIEKKPELDAAFSLNKGYTNHVSKVGAETDPELSSKLGYFNETTKKSTVNSKNSGDKTIRELPYSSEFERTSEIMTVQKTNGGTSHLMESMGNLDRVLEINSLHLLDQKLNYALSKPYDISNTHIDLNLVEKQISKVPELGIFYAKVILSPSYYRISTPSELLVNYSVPSSGTFQETINENENPNPTNPNVNPSYTKNKIQYVPSFTTGALILFDHGKTKLSTGIKYTQLQFSTSSSEKLGNKTDGFFLNKFSKIKYNFLQLPIMLHRSIAQFGNHEFLIHGGMELQIGLKNSYIFEQTKINPSISNKIYPDRKITALYSDRKFTKGIFEGGDARENSIMNYLFGIDYAYTLNKRVKIASELNYNAMIGNQTFGPNYNKLSNIAFGIGAMISLK